MAGSASSPPVGLPCPSCGAVSPSGSRFCNQCGGSLSLSPPQAPSAVSGALSVPPPPPPLAAPPLDIRQKVDGDRGFLKRLQLLIPGFRGYRQAEDVRASDSL